MERKVTVLIVEDEKHHALVLRKMTEKLGYEVVGWASDAKEALAMLFEKRPDVVLLDIQLAVGHEGFDVAQHINDNFMKTPFIFMTSLIDRATLQEAAKLKPHAYLPKPYKADELLAAIEMAVFNDESEMEAVIDKADDALRNGFVFVRTKQPMMIKVPLADILYFEADRNYSNFYSTDAKYTIRRNLSYVEDRIESSDFIRIHKSYIINARYIRSINYDTVFLVNAKEIPLGRTYKDELEKKITDL
jgi:DNA-binding LytR/AlgR family response regulator